MFRYVVVLLPLLVVLNAEDGEPYSGKVFLGIDVETVKLEKDKRYESAFGLKVTRVAVLSSAEAGGLAPGDIIVSMDGEVWKGEDIRLSYSFGKEGKKFRPGEEVKMQVLKNGEGAKNELKSISFQLQPYPFTRKEEGGTPANAVLRPDLEKITPAYETLCRKLIEQAGFREDSDNLQLRLNRCEEFPDPNRLALNRYVHRGPFQVEAVSRELIQVGREKPALPSTSLSLARHALLNFEKREPAETPKISFTSYKDTDLKGHLSYIEAVLKAAAEAHAKAFAGLSNDDVEFIRSHRGGMLDSYFESRMLSYDSVSARQRSSSELIALAPKLNVEALINQAEIVSNLFEPFFLKSLRAAAEGSGIGITQPTISQRGTDYGVILIGGTGRSRYEGNQYAAIYDLGGDDVYANNLATSIWGKIPSAVIVDYEGDDAYETHEPFRQGCGDFGVGALVDLSGNDSYVCTRFGQGCGFFGVGMLFDHSGNDIYRGLEMNQGVGHWGAGILVDLKGHDRYESHDTSQGVGLSGGFGLILEAEGDDEYYCKGTKPTGYGSSPGVFEGWGQAMGIGYRPYASGGIGMILDITGKDRFEAGNFCQGGGYFYAFGLLANLGNDDDIYIGSRYAQGFGCHQASGALIEEGGNDRYQTRQFVAQGLAWDEATALFMDEAGDDRYEGGGFSHGASAMNGWALFIDKKGKDTYLYTDQARAGGNSYHGGKSLSFFVDAGGQEDSFPNKPNNGIVTVGENSIFVDLPGSIEDALEGDAWKKLMNVENK
ncbi:MAG: PDZ domain-containing protein [Planctomycetota bacterium]|nr:PDZ domain-containing protein [Planctomycetota bacterium]MDA1139657.1 PDZ domain-containing protein [Planctomycetota bacterium]